MFRRYLRRRGITARIARIGRDSSQRLCRHRWVVERTIGWLLSYKRLALRYDRTALTVTARWGDVPGSGVAGRRS
jgi:transposase